MLILCSSYVICRQGRFTAVTIYKSLVRPILEHADVVFDNLTNVLVQQIDTVQREAIVLITCAYKCTPTHLLHTETGIEYMQDRQKQHRLILFHKTRGNVNPLD